VDLHQRLSAQQWSQRHRFVLATLVVHAAGLAWFLGRGALPLDLVTTYLLVITMQAVLSLTPRLSPPVRQVFAAGSLLTASAVLVEASGRIAAAHLSFALVLCILTLYQDVFTYLGAVCFAALYHLGLGSLQPEFIYPPGLVGDAAFAWSLTFFAAALMTSLSGVFGWVLSARSMHESETLKVALAEAGLRERQARDLNDTVVQHLATAVYASEEGDTEGAASAARDGLIAARRLVASLRAPAWLEDRTLLRDDPSQPGDDR
jgi:hypothetical protein